MITQLTEEKAAEIRDEWLAIGLSTEPADRPAAEEGIRMTYKAVDLTPPKEITWADSPLAGAVLRKNMPGSTSTAWSSGLMYGAHNAGYYAYFAAMREIGVTGLEVLLGQEQVARSAGWWWCFRDCAIVTDRPEYLSRDGQARLHAENGPAIRYRDGWGFYSWHGRRVPSWVVENPTAERIAAEANTEIRRCGIESMGWDRFISAADLKMCGTPQPDPGNPGQELTLYDVPERLWGTRIRLLLAVNGSAERDGTRRKYGLTVPESVRTPLEAAAWTAGMASENYARMVRRT